jgi:hypothetical protein
LPKNEPECYTCSALYHLARMRESPKKVKMFLLVFLLNPQITPNHILFKF